MNKRVIVVDDEEPIRNLLKSRLEREGYEVVTATGAPEAEAAFASGKEPCVMVTDLKMPGKDGFALMSWSKQKSPLTRVIVITGHGEKEAAVKALRQGASDYLEKPFDMDDLAHSVKRATREYQLERENQDMVGRLQARVERVEGKSEDKYWYVSKSSAMTKANEWLSVLRRESMRADAEEPTVLILGESGTGKEGIARMIHAGSRRGKGPWVAVNCANFNEQLLESELFGHERGAFTGANTLKRGLFEIAKGGTLLLDEIGEMDVKLQAKLLRVLQEKSFRRVGGTTDLETDVRVIAATNRDLKSKVQSNEFRDDLYHRLSRVVVEVPSLQERREDIVPMAFEFAQRAFHSRAKRFEGFAPEAEAALADYSWPGNVRELLNVIERAALVFEGNGPLGAKDLMVPSRGAGGAKLKVVGGNAVSSAMTDPEGFISMKKRWSDAFEREYLVATLERHEGNVSAAAREAKIDRSNFLRLLRRHGIKAQEYRGALDETGTDSGFESGTGSDEGMAA